MSDLRGKRALITGASRGVGRGIATALARAGATVLVCARTQAALDDTKREIERHGGRAEIVAGDLSTRAGCRDVAARSGSIDILVNNAALTDARHQPLLAADDEYWDSNFQLNLFAPLALIQALGPGMVERRRGVIINISSIAAQRGRPMRGPYSASKTALESITKTAAMELGGYGVRVVAVAPGMTETPAVHAALPEGLTPDDLGGRYIPIGRMTQSEEIGNLCCFLASDAAGAITGTVVTIDGGSTAGNYAFRLQADAD
jgi:NAD(P)-dependent dehydrogenase (short-subunit alcohol dehydrogenase family)